MTDEKLREIAIAHGYSRDILQGSRVSGVARAFAKAMLEEAATFTDKQAQIELTQGLGGQNPSVAAELRTHADRIRALAAKLDGEELK